MIISADRNKSFASRQLALLDAVKISVMLSIPNVIIFLHPPKTGGTNLVFVAEAMSQTLPFKSIRFPVPRVINRSPNLITEGWVGGLESLKSLRSFNIPSERLTFISGHFPYGAHNYLNIPPESNSYITLIRDPIQRELSTVNFDYQRGYVSAQDATAYLLEVSLDNPQTRMLAGEEHMTGICDANTLLKAKDNIDKFLLAGVTEDTNTFIQVISSLLHWCPIALARTQITKEKCLEPNTELVEKLRMKHSYDVRLYEYVKEKWYNWKKSNVIFESAGHSENVITCIDANYAFTRRPIYLTREEIYEHNNKWDVTDIIQISQNHVELHAQGI